MIVFMAADDAASRVTQALNQPDEPSIHVPAAPVFQALRWLSTGRFKMNGKLREAGKQSGSQPWDKRIRRQPVPASTHAAACFAGCWPSARRLLPKTV
jgi:hypothetical protein